MPTYFFAQSFAKIARLHQHLHQTPLRGFGRPARQRRLRLYFAAALHGRSPQCFPQYRLVHAQLLRDARGPLRAQERAGDPLHEGHKKIHRAQLLFGGAHAELARPADQVIEIGRRAFEQLAIAACAFGADECIRIFATGQRQNPHIAVVFEQDGKRTLRRRLTRCVGIVVHDHAPRKTAE